MGNLKAVLLISAADPDKPTSRCIAHCEKNGYEVVSVVYIDADNPEKWRDAFAAIASGEADILVHSGILDPHVEIAGQPIRRATNAAPANSQRRPRRVS
jgi:hypothetical protein